MLPLTALARLSPCTPSSKLDSVQLDSNPSFSAIEEFGDVVPLALGARPAAPKWVPTG